MSLLILQHHRHPLLTMVVDVVHTINPLPNSNAEFIQIINPAATRGAYDCLMENETNDIKPWYRPLLLQVSVVKPNQAVTQDTLSSTLCLRNVLIVSLLLMMIIMDINCILIQ